MRDLRKLHALINTTTFIVTECVFIFNFKKVHRRICCKFAILKKKVKQGLSSVKAIGSLDNNEHNPTFNKEVYEAIKPVYENLNRNELSGGCLGGPTTNSDGKFNALKSIFYFGFDLAIYIIDEYISDIMN